MRYATTVVVCMMLYGCLGGPKNVRPVENFELERYLGKWYEIARLDHSFERGLENVTAQYSLREDGGIDVVNRGYSPEQGECVEARGKAYFVDNPTKGHLKVTFFGPFYGSYVIFELDKTNYQYSFVAGPNYSYLWLLSRTPTVSDKLMARFVDRSETLGFDTAELIKVPHKQDEQRLTDCSHYE